MLIFIVDPQLSAPADFDQPVISIHSPTILSNFNLCYCLPTPNRLLVSEAIISSGPSSVLTAPTISHADNCTYVNGVFSALGSVSLASDRDADIWVNNLGEDEVGIGKVVEGKKEAKNEVEGAAGTEAPKEESHSHAAPPGMEM